MRLAPFSYSVCARAGKKPSHRCPAVEVAAPSGPLLEQQPDADVLEEDFEDIGIHQMIASLLSTSDRCMTSGNSVRGPWIEKPATQ